MTLWFHKSVLLYIFVDVWIFLTVTSRDLYAIVISLVINDAWIPNNKVMNNDYLLTCLMRRMCLLWWILMIGCLLLKLLGDAWKHCILSMMLMMLKSLMLHYPILLLDDEDVHFASMLLLSNVHVVGSYMVYGGCWWLSWSYNLIVEVLVLVINFIYVSWYKRSCKDPCFKSL